MKTIADFPVGCRVKLTETAIQGLSKLTPVVWPERRIVRGTVTGYTNVPWMQEIKNICIKWDAGYIVEPTLHPDHLAVVKSGLEKVSVRWRTLRGGKRQEGLDFTWDEWQVVSGRRIFSRHDTSDLAYVGAKNRLEFLENGN